MSTPSHNPGKTFVPPALRRRKIAIALVLLAGAVVAAFAYVQWREVARPQESVATFTVLHGPLTISISESGTIQNRDLVIVKSEVQGKASLLSLILEGTTVEKGQLLAELDSSQLVDQKTQQSITVMNAEASFVSARENLAVTQSQAESDASKAQLDVNFAALDLKKYLEGDYPQDVRQGEADVTVAKEDLQRANDQLEWSKRLAEEKFITRTELQADEIAAHKADLNLKLAEARLALLKQYTYDRQIQQLKSNVEQTAAALDRVKRKGTADVVQAQASLKAKEAEYLRQKGQLEKLDQQIAKCKIYAPVGGMVVYATTGKASFRGNVEPLAEGQDIRERQELIYLPTTMSMMAEVKIHESSLRKMRKDLPVRVTVDAVPGKTFRGRVGKIGLLPDAQSVFMNPDLKVYDTDIFLEGDATELRAGMTCKAEIIVATYDDAVYVPVQSVVRVNGKTTVYLPGRGNTSVPREVEIGLDNNQMVHIVKGLAAGEQVLLSPPLGPSSAPILEEPTGSMPKPEAPATGPAAGPAAAPAPAVSGNGVETTPAVTPSAEPPAAFDAEKFRAMSREERQKYMEGMTPEQRDAMRKQMGGGSGRSPRRAPVGAGTPAPAPEGP